MYTDENPSLLRGKKDASALKNTDKVFLLCRCLSIKIFSLIEYNTAPLAGTGLLLCLCVIVFYCVAGDVAAVLYAEVASHVAEVIDAAVDIDRFDIWLTVAHFDL